MNCAHAPRPPNPQSSPQSNRAASPIVPPSSPATASLFIDRVSGPPSIESTAIATSARVASRRPGAHVPHRRRPMRRLGVSLTSLDIAADVSRYPAPRSARRGLCRPSRKRRHTNVYRKTHTFATDQTYGPNVCKVGRKAENGRTPLIKEDLTSRLFNRHTRRAHREPARGSSPGTHVNDGKGVSDVPPRRVDITDGGVVRRRECDEPRGARARSRVARSSNPGRGRDSTSIAPREAAQHQRAPGLRLLQHQV